MQAQYQQKDKATGKTNKHTTDIKLLLQISCQSINSQTKGKKMQDIYEPVELNSS